MGHSAIIAVDPKTGTTRYYEYGRYDPPRDFGVVRNPSIPNLVIGPDGRPTPGSLRALYDWLSKNLGKGSPVVGEYDPTADYQKVIDFAERRMRDPNRSPYSPFFNNCFTFSDEAQRAGH